jgi:cation diffusion facilitator family transporter
MAASRGVVWAALIANGAIAVLKFIGFLLTGSPSMLSETYHSVSDTGNQVFLLIGIRYGGRETSRRHPFGYGKAQFFFSFLVAVLLFGIAGWESVTHGYEQLTHPSGHGGEPFELFGTLVEPVYVNYAVLGGAFVFEAWAFLKARAELQRQMAEHGWSGYREAFRKTSDTTTLTAFTEDTVALAGIVLAFVGVLLSQLTGNPLFDAAGAFLIGLLLMGFALALAWENKRLLLGEALASEDAATLRELLADDEAVSGVVDFRSVYFGPERVLVVADVTFDPALSADDIESHIDRLAEELRATNDHIGRVYIEPAA